MQGSKAVIELLNEVLTAELTAVNQYFVHAKMCENWGYQKLAGYLRNESIDEMRHAEQLIERILYLEGMPNLQRLNAFAVGESVAEQFRLDLDVERQAISRLNAGIALCVGEADHGSRELLEQILTAEEEHLDWVESQLTLIAQVGEANYLAQQIG